MFFKIIGVFLIICLTDSMVSDIREYLKNRNPWGGISAAISVIAVALVSYGGLLIIKDNENWEPFMLFGCLISMVGDYFSAKRDGEDGAFKNKLMPVIVALVIGLVIALILAFN